MADTAEGRARHRGHRQGFRAGRFRPRTERTASDGGEMRGTGRRFPNRGGNAAGSDRGQSTAFSRDQLEEYLDRGCEAITSSLDSRQTFINNLATDDGLSRIRPILDADFSMTYSVFKPSFDPHCLMFLRLITQDEIRHSLVLEKAVGTIYNVVYGHDGSRGVRFFKKIADHLVHLASEAEAVNREVSPLEKALPLITKALLNTLILNQGAAVKTEFAAILDQLHQCYYVGDIDSGCASSDLGSSHNNILKIKDIISSGNNLTTFKTANSRTSSQRQSRPHFPEPDADPPGDLSDLGPRHDNDHALISNIEILPTISEILNDHRPDYLPSRWDLRSPSKHHEMGIFQLLDSQFRLLREDTSGLLRDTLRLILGNWDIFCHGHDWKVKRNILRQSSATPVQIYSNPKIQDITSDAIKGLQIAMEFDQVRAAKSPSAWKRKKRWHESRALREGGPLLALVHGADDDTSVTFFQVSRREVWSKLNDQQGGWPESQNIRDLASDVNRAMIVLRLVNPTSKDALANLVRLTSNGCSVSSSAPLLLVEFPAVSYNSFEGVLRGLQTLHKNPSAIPFTNWLAPRIYDDNMGNDFTNHDDQKIVFPPPKYLRDDIVLDLGCIPRSASSSDNTTTSSTTFSIRDDPHELAKKLTNITTLDSGQAVAMVSALRHEIALIQGPPGTGKSYVGIQIARSIAASRVRLGLGPILCV